MVNMKRIKDHPEYFITEDGQVISKRFNRPMKVLVDWCGYIRVGLSVNKKTKGFLVHRLVAATYIENPKNLPLVNHINNIPSDNRVDNLEWVSYKENSVWRFYSNCICPRCGLHFIPAKDKHR